MRSLGSAAGADERLPADWCCRGMVSRWQVPFLTDPFKAALQLAYGQLATRDRFSSEVRAHLLAKGFDEVVAENVVQFLTERKLLNDDKTTQHLIENKSGKRSVGIEKLRAELEK